MASLLGRDITRDDWDDMEANLYEYIKQRNANPCELAESISFAICNGNISMFNNICIKNNFNQDKILKISDNIWD